MRKEARFKKYISSGRFFTKTTLNKVFKLKRSKWKSFKLKFFIKKSVIKFYTLKKQKTKLKTWENKKLYFKNFIKGKRLLDLKFNLFLKVSKMLRSSKFLKRKNEKLRFLFIQNFYRLDALLFFLNIAKSIHQARQLLNSGFFKINNRPVFFTKKLKKGDIITFNIIKIQKFLNTNVILNLSEFNNQVYSFIEFDFYTNSFIILKNENEISTSDLSLFLKERFEIKYW